VIKIPPLHHQTEVQAKQKPARSLILSLSLFFFSCCYQLDVEDEVNRSNKTTIQQLGGSILASELPPTKTKKPILFCTL